MSKHLPSVIWPTRALAFSTKPYQCVATADKHNVKIAFMPGNSEDGLAHIISRKDARLLARRINQCLDRTK